MRKKQPTIEEVREQFRKKGFPVGTWEEREEGPVNTPGIAEETKKGLENIKAMLEEQVKQDQLAMAKATEELIRLEHGGASSLGVK